MVIITDDDDAAAAAFRFADKQMRLLRLKAARAQLEEKCVKALERRKQKDKLVLSVIICKLTPLSVRPSVRKKTGGS